MAGSVAEVTEHVEHHTCAMHNQNRGQSGLQSWKVHVHQEHARAPAKLCKEMRDTLVQEVQLEAWILCPLRERMQILKSAGQIPASGAPDRDSQAIAVGGLMLEASA